MCRETLHAQLSYNSRPFFIDLRLQLTSMTSLDRLKDVLEIMAQYDAAFSYIALTLSGTPLMRRSSHWRHNGDRCLETCSDTYILVCDVWIFHRLSAFPTSSPASANPGWAPPPVCSTPECSRASADDQIALERLRQGGGVPTRIC